MTAKCPSDLNSNLSSILAVSSLQGWENVTTNSTFRTDWQGFPRPLDLKVGDPGAGDEKDVLDFNNFSLSFFLLLVQWAICSVGILGNCVVLIIYHRRVEKSPSEVFIMTVAGLDISMCVCSIFFTATQDPLFKNTNCFVFCSAGNFSFDVINTASAVLTFIICVNRYFAVCQPTSYPLLFAGRKTAGILALCALLSLLNCPIGLLMCGKFREAADLPCSCDQVIYVTPPIDLLKLFWVLIRTSMLLINVGAMCYVYPKIFSAMRERTMRMKKLTSVPAISSMRYCNTEEKVTGVMSVCLITAQHNSVTSPPIDRSNGAHPERPHGVTSYKYSNNSTALVSVAASSVANNIKTNEPLVKEDREVTVGAKRSGTTDENIKTHRDVKLTSTLLTVTIAYATLMTPDIIVHVSDTFSLMSSSSFHILRTFSQTLYLANFVINPFIHYWVNSYFKSEFQRRFLRCVE